jgi:hypothetical protein
MNLGVKKLHSKQANHPRLYDPPAFVEYLRHGLLLVLLKSLCFIYARMRGYLTFGTGLSKNSHNGSHPSPTGTPTFAPAGRAH